MFVLSIGNTISNILCAETYLTENIRDILKNTCKQNQEVCYKRIVNNRQPFCGHMKTKNLNLNILYESLYGIN